VEKRGKSFWAVHNIWLHLHKVLLQLQSSKGRAKMSGAKWAATANAAYTQCGAEQQRKQTGE